MQVENVQHKTLAAGRWAEMPLSLQMLNIGSEISRANRWKAKGNQAQVERAVFRALELIDLTIEALEMTNADAFRRIASSGANPRRFISFNKNRLNVLKDKRTRRKYASMFMIKTTPQGDIDTDDEKSAERLVKFLCNKAAIDPVENEPKEVAAMKGWK